jgi:hypothetical protein
VTLFAITPVAQALNAPMGAAPDGNRFVVTEAPFAGRQALHLLTNWPTRLAGR